MFVGYLRFGSSRSISLPDAAEMPPPTVRTLPVAALEMASQRVGGEAMFAALKIGVAEFVPATPPVKPLHVSWFTPERPEFWNALLTQTYAGRPTKLPM